ncbi:MAG: flagellar type III secretion system pore protein FliP, partial [Pseudomonadales bacterium]
MLQNRLFKLRGAHNDLGLSTGAALALLVVLVLLPAPGFAQSGGLPAFNVTSWAEGEQTYSLSLQILALMSGIAILPSLLLGMTAFTRIIIVLSIMRQALGTQQTPPNQVLVSIAMF